MNPQEVEEKFTKYLNLKKINPGEKQYFQTTRLWIEKRKEAYNFYRPYFVPERLIDLNSLRTHFKNWMKFSNNCSWTNFPRVGYGSLDYLNTLSETLKIVQDESQPIEERYDLCLHGRHKVPFIGPGILTGFLHTMHPNKYAVLNGSTARTLNKINGSSKYVISYDSGKKYSNVNEWCKELALLMKTDLTTIDGFMWYIATGNV